MSGTDGPLRDTPDAALEALRACRLFSSMDDVSLGMVGAALRPRKFRRGETIFHAGDPGDALFIVATGEVKITIQSDDGSEPAILTTVGPGGFFGELALLDGAPAGFVSLEFRQPFFTLHPQAWVPDLIVTESARGRDIGAALLDAAFGDAEGFGVDARRIEPRQTVVETVGTAQAVEIGDREPYGREG